MVLLNAFPVGKLVVFQINRYLYLHDTMIDGRIFL